MIDETDRILLSALQRDARQSFTALGRQVGLSSPAVAERVRRMEDVGLITGYTLQVDRRRMGWDITAMVRLTCPGEFYQAVHRLSQEMAEVLECHHVTGEDSFMLKLIARDMAHLEAVISRFRSFGHSVSSIVMSTNVEGKPVAPPPGKAGHA